MQQYQYTSIADITPMAQTTFYKAGDLGVDVQQFIRQELAISS